MLMDNISTVSRNVCQTVFLNPGLDPDLLDHFAYKKLAKFLEIRGALFKNEMNTISPNHTRVPAKTVTIA